MKRTAFDESRDQHTAAETNAERALMCAAQGCPNRWSVDFGKRLCSADFRADADPHAWPRITQEQLEQETDRAYRRQFPAPAPARVDKRAAIAALRNLGSALGQPKGVSWATRLQKRADGGAHLTPFQRECMETALRGRAGADSCALVATAHQPDNYLLPPGMRQDYPEEFA